MKNRIFQLICIYVLIVVLMALQKLAYAVAFGNFGWADAFSAMLHGLSMDASMAGYLTVIPAIIEMVSIWTVKPAMLAGKIYIGIIAFLMALAGISNIALYSYWKFPLDFTPVFYLTTSVEAATASLTWRGWLLAIVLLIFVSEIFYWVLTIPYRCIPIKWKHKESTKFRRSRCLAVLIVLTALLFIPIRGGFTVSTMNLSRAYFSSDMRLNHAAVNPMFSFMYSVSHLKNLKGQFQFMPQAQADVLMRRMYSGPKAPIASLPFQPDIHIVLLESFSSHLLPSLGGEAIAMHLDSLGREGLMFTNIYASSFRTDRALPAVLNGYPAQPTTSLMKYVNKLDSLPAIGRSLRDAGYSTAYYYGGDANFTNMNALLVAGGFDRIVSDKDFPINQRLSKWGVHDDAVFALALDEAREPSSTPRLAVIQTSSSHEPFEVPHRGQLRDARANAFEYTDSCLWAYVEGLRQLPNYDRTLIVIVPDHYGAYPELEDHEQRHRVPLILSGGAVKHIQWGVAPLEIGDALDRIGSQTDIAATVLALAGVDHQGFQFSNNLLDSARPAFAFFSEPSWAALAAPEGMAEISVDTKEKTNQAPDSLYRLLEAYLQSLYLDLDAR
ncbi:MAG: LTA synthase family protein [Bacteroidales bacterium]|nr:LTA synthase family protein [Bacteroidales bacterium]